MLRVFNINTKTTNIHLTIFKFYGKSLTGNYLCAESCTFSFLSPGEEFLRRTGEAFKDSRYFPTDRQTVIRKLTSAFWDCFQTEPERFFLRLKTHISVWQINLTSKLKKGNLKELFFTSTNKYKRDSRRNCLLRRRLQRAKSLSWRDLNVAVNILS